MIMRNGPQKTLLINPHSNVNLFKLQEPDKHQFLKGRPNLNSSITQTFFQLYHS